MAEFIAFKLHGRNFRYYSVNRIDSEFHNKTGNWRPVGITNHGNYKKISFKVDGKFINMKLHRVIYYAHNQSWNIYHTTRDNSIDHIRHEVGVPLDNSITNLRLVNQQKNSYNKNCKGHYFHKQAKKYVAQIDAEGKRHYLGLFDTADEARTAYLEAKKSYHILPS